MPELVVGDRRNRRRGDRLEDGPGLVYVALQEAGPYFQRLPEPGFGAGRMGGVELCEHVRAEPGRQDGVHQRILPGMLAGEKSFDHGRRQRIDPGAE